MTRIDELIAIFTHRPQGSPGVRTPVHSTDDVEAVLAELKHRGYQAAVLDDTYRINKDLLIDLDKSRQPSFIADTQLAMFEYKLREKKMEENVTFRLAFHLRRALQELNGIRARDGVNEDYFSQVIEDGFAALEAAGTPYTPWDFK